ncbi:hypothetical protein GWK08_09315 [Leptobacterium flavescens]|uniref:Exo-alpha-sialidase n=1 Tax=Leptobacterium flavescens TaxID=472055 RepID=A0A6P0UK01_9FLAO|nr:PD40 domain-containing protein [Leptobacterium flavescens]NER13635.1 hypothetical protein [Leptobacterium flavescens]
MNKLIITGLILMSLVSCKKKTEPEELKLNIGDMINYEPEMLAPGVISGAAFEGHASVSPDGKEIYYSVYSNDHAYSTIVYSVRTGGKWEEPRIAPFSGKYRDGSPALSPDGMRLYFSSNRPVNGKEQNASNDIWYVNRTGTGWSEAIHLDNSINTPYNEFSPSVDRDGNLYFCSNRPEGYGDMDVYYSEYYEGTYKKAVILNDSVNSVYHEGNVGVSPDGNQLFIMIQHKPGDYGYDDIHYSKKIDGKWSKAKNIGPKVNTYTYDFSPKISPDGKVLYFSSRINRDFNQPDSLYTYRSFLQYLNSPLNGFGNIFRIELDKLDLDDE